MKTRICKICHIEYPETSEFFYVGKRHKGGLFTRCKTCERTKSLNYHNNHREESNDKIKEWRSKRDPEVKREYDRRYSASHPEIIKKCRKRRAEIYGWAYNRDQRRAKINENGGKYTREDITKQYKSQKGICYWCGANLENVYQVDHVIPVSRGGSNDPSNLVVSCQSCNASKGAKMPGEWSGSNKFL